MQKGEGAQRGKILPLFAMTSFSTLNRIMFSPVSSEGEREEVGERRGDAGKCLR